MLARAISIGSLLSGLFITLQYLSLCDCTDRILPTGLYAQAEEPGKTRPPLHIEYGGLNRPAKNHNINYSDRLNPYPGKSASERLLAAYTDTGPGHFPRSAENQNRTPIILLWCAWIIFALGSGLALMSYLCLLARRRDRLSSSLLENHPDLIFRVDHGGRIICASPAVAGYFDTGQGKMNGKKFADLIADTEKRKDIAHCIDLVLTNSKPLEQECERNTSRGRIVFNLRLIPERTEIGKLRSVVVVARDITACRRLEEERNKASRLESLGVLAGGIAHEFNNVLTGIMGNLSLARLIGNFSDQIDHMLGNAEKSCERARELTGRLLIFASGGSPRKQVVELAPLIRRTVDKKLATTAITIHFDPPSELTQVWADPAQLTGAVNHIIDNAAWAMGGTGKFEIAVADVELDLHNASGLPAGKYVRISFRDNGPGISKEIRSKIFDPYFSTREQANGLGLTTVHFILSRHGGTIELENRQEPGAAFLVHLPTLTGPPEDTSSRNPKPARTNPARILLMDDEPDLRVVSEKIIQHLGYLVMTAADGEEALAIYKQALETGNGIDLVILDITVPDGMGGLETIKHLKQLDPDVSAIVSSGYSTDPVISAFRDYGFVGALPKPYRMEELEKVLSNLL